MPLPSHLKDCFRLSSPNQKHYQAFDILGLLHYVLVLNIMTKRCVELTFWYSLLQACVSTRTGISSAGDCFKSLELVLQCLGPPLGSTEQEVCIQYIRGYFSYLFWKICLLIVLLKGAEAFSAPFLPIFPSHLQRESHCFSSHRFAFSPVQAQESGSSVSAPESCFCAP